LPHIQNRVLATHQQKTVREPRDHENVVFYK